jgi:glutamine amidotransferase-like uncharacterized protein
MKTITIFVNHPQCELDCAHAMASAFKPAFNVKMITIDEFNSDTLADTDILVFGGGIGDADDFDSIFLPDDIRILKNYLANGGKYLGICMGAYWAGKNYFDILGDTDAVQYIEQPDTDIFTEFETVAFVHWHGLECKMYFYDGCAFVGDLENCDIVGTYDNGDAMAIVKNNVGAIGCHPESEKWWHEYIGDYENHHNTLLQFALDL